MKYLKYFETEAGYASYKNGSDYVTPNVSYTVDSAKVYYNPTEAKETRLVCTYNVTDTANITKLCYKSTNFALMEVDGVLLDSVTTEYTFDTAGEHTVKFDLVDPTSIDGVGTFWNCTNLTSVTIPDSVTEIGGSAFQGCTGLTSITIPDSVTSIGAQAFYQCSGLTGELVIPNSVTSIAYHAFNKCSGLTSVEIGSGCTSIAYGVFRDCTGLTEIISHASTAPAIVGSTFEGVKSNGILKVPLGSDYSTWMSKDPTYLGFYNWTIEYI